MSQPGTDPWAVADQSTAAAPANQNSPQAASDPWATASGPAPWRPNEQEASEAVLGIAPGAIITSKQRTPEKNAAVSGAPNSMHLYGEAADVVLPKGMTATQFRSQLEAQGYPITEFLVEKKGDPHSTGDHVHWGWGPKGTSAPQPAADPWAPIAEKPPQAAPSGITQTAKPQPSWAEVFDPMKLGKTAIDAFEQTAIGLAGMIYNDDPTKQAQDIIPGVLPNPFAKSMLTPEQKAAMEKARAPVNSWLAKTGADIAQDIRANSPELDPISAKGIAYNTTTGIIQMAPILAATVITKSPTVGAALMASQAAGQKYAESLDAGRTHEQAAMDAQFSGMVNGALGSVPLHVLMKPGGTFLQKTLQNAGAFGLQSLTTEALQVGYDWGLVNPNMTLKQAWDRVESAGIVGTLTGGLFGAGHAGFEAAVARLHANPPPKPRVEPSFANQPPPQQPNAPETPAAAAPARGPVQADLEASIGLRPAGAPPEPSFRTNAPNIRDEHDLEVARLERDGTEQATKTLPPAYGNDFERFLRDNSNVVIGKPPEHIPQTESDNEMARDEFWNAPKPSMEKPAAPEPRAALPDSAGIPTRPLEQDVAITASGRQVPVRYAVVEAAHLVPSQTQEGHPNPNFPGELQPRDRTRAVSQAQIASIAQNINPRLLDKSVNASDGAPIISPAGIVESGNGRSLAIQRAYAQDLPSAGQYRDYLASQGYPVDGMTAPVLVRVREGEMSPTDRQAFVREANHSGQLGYSATERAMSDAAATPDSTLDLYRGGDVESVANREFVRSFMRAAIPANDHAGMIDAHGGLSQEAVRRVRSALLAKAYASPDLISAIVESQDNNIKAIGGALTDAAADWAKMRGRVNAGEIPGSLDQTSKLLEAVNLIEHARKEGRNVAEYVAQPDIFTGQAVDPDVEAWLRLMFRNTKDWTQPVGRDKLADALRYYAQEALKVQAGPNLLGAEPPSASAVLAATKAKQEREYADRSAQTTASLGFGQGFRSPGGAGVGGESQAPAPGRGSEIAPNRDQSAAIASGELEPGPFGPQPKDFAFKPAVSDERSNLSDDLENYMTASKAVTAPERVHAVANYILGRGRKTGHETLAIVGPDGADLAALTDGKKNVVGFGAEVQERLSKPETKAITFHNHPNSGAPSIGDIATLSSPGQRDLVVLGHDGSFHSARLAAEILTSDKSRAATALGNIARAAASPVFDAVMERFRAGQFDAQTAYILENHLRNLALDYAGVIDYQSSRNVADYTRGDWTDAVIKEASDAAARTLQRHYAADIRRSEERVARGFHRPAEPVRFAEGMAAILGRDGSLQGRAGLPGAEGANAKPAGWQKPVQLKLLEEENRYERERQPFFSALTRSIEESKLSRAAAKDWSGLIDNLRNKGVKQEEIDWSGVKDWLASQTGPITKDQVLQHLRENEVKVQEVVKGATGKIPTLDEQAQALYGKPFAELGIDDQNRVHDFIYEKTKRVDEEPKFASYTLPGGENYRELLLTLPSKPHADADILTTAKDLAQKYGDDWESLGPNGRQGYADQARGVLDRSTGTFKSGHFEEPNILAHIRFDDRTGPNGEGILHIAEIQSDWHQKGRRYGYIGEGDAAWQEARKLTDEQFALVMKGGKEGRTAEQVRATPEWQDLETRRRAALERKVSAVVPNAPFKSSWHELAMKRALRYAAEHGYDKLTWDTGETQADRYDLSKQIKTVQWFPKEEGYLAPNENLLEAFDHAGQKVLDQKVEAKDLPDVIGKEAAQKLIDAESTDSHRGRIKQISGIDLKVGGEGMKGFYDRILPAFLNKYAKKWGVKVGAGTVPKSETLSFNDFKEKHVRMWPSITADHLAAAYENYKSQVANTAVHELPITPAMRESVMGGQALFERPRFGQRVAEPGTKLKMLAHDVAAEPVETPTRSEQRVMDQVAAIAKKIVPKATVLPARKILSIEPGSKQTQGDRIWGATVHPFRGDHGIKRLIAWSLESPDQVGTLKHEAIHWLRNSNFIDPHEWAGLERAAANGNWIGRYQIDARYPGVPRELKIEEAIAEAYGHWRRAPSIFPRIVHPIFEKVANLLGRIGDNIRKAFGADTTAEDVFHRINKGEIGQRSRQPAIRDEAAQFQKEEKDRSKDMFATEAGALDAKGNALPQTVIPGAEKSAVQLAKAREMAGHGLKATKATQKDAGPLFGGTGANRDQGTLFQKGPPRSFHETPAPPAPTAIDRAKERLAEAGTDVTKIVEAAQMLATPMVLGDSEFRASAKDFANLKRLSRDRAMIEDKRLQDEFTQDQRKKMFRAADEQSIAMQQGKSTDGIGLAKLTPAERDTVLRQQADAQSVWNAMKNAGMVKAEGIPSYVPHLYVEMAETGAKHIGGSEARRIPGMGKNLTTSASHMKHRKYLTGEEGAAALSKKTGKAAQMIDDIRVLPLATMRMRDALAGRAFINSIKERGAAMGTENVVEGHEPAGGGWFTMDHPAFKTWRPKFITEEGTGKVVIAQDQNGQPVFERVPIYVRNEFEGPLRAVLSLDNGRVYNGLMNLKGKVMNNIMFSPLIQLHLMTELGRALPVAPMKILSLKILFEGNKAKQDIATRTEAIMHGLVPISHQGAMVDVSSIAQPDNIVPGRSWTAKIVGAVPGWLDPRAGDAVKRTIDKMGDFLHNTLLWDRVADLQFGLYTTMRDHLVEDKHMDPDMAGKLAAHWANRYAGTLPAEAMSVWARKIANIMLFSRTYTLGNVGVMKDAIVGLPRDVQAQIRRSGGDTAVKKAVSLGRRKTMAVLAVDIALLYASNSLLQNAFAYFTGRQSSDEIIQGYVDRMKKLGSWMAANPIAAVNPFNELNRLSATSENEIDEMTNQPFQRILVGYDKQGTAIYMRNPFGKFGEEMANWMQAPGATIKLKLSPFVHPGYDAFVNDKGLGRPLYNVDDPAQVVMAKIAQHYMEGQLPMEQINAVHDIVTGQQKSTDVLKLAGRVVGVTVRRGYPGGPAVGLAAQVQRRHYQAIDAAMPGIIQQIKDGDVKGARVAMSKLHIPPRRQLYYIQSAKHPGRSAVKYFNKDATPDEIERMRELRGGQ